MKFQLPQETIFYLLEKSMKRYRKLAQHHINEAGYDITINQLILLSHLNVNSEASQVDLAELLFKDFASVARMVDILTKKGFITRTENKIDRRKKDLLLTQKSKRMLLKIIPLIEKYRSIALNGFSKSELPLISKFLNRLIENCEVHIDSVKSHS